MNITIEEINNSIKEIFKEAQILSSNSVYEKIQDSDNLKLVIFFNKMFEEKSSVLYTKLIFIVNKEKTQLVENTFSYLYDINCVYQKISFEDIIDFGKKVKNVFDNKKFGRNLTILSEFVGKPAFLINNWFQKNDVTGFSVFNVKYGPKMYIMPCKSLFFSFDINIDNTTNIEFIIRKENEKKFSFSFKIYDKTITIEKTDLDDLVETIGDTLKNNL